ncbi:MAG: DCC1-like thiol-disulfide oxidoreductase family protein [Acidobacteriota bacterium]
MTEQEEPIGGVLYDDSCGFCRRWVPFWAGALSKRGFAIAPLQSEWVVQRLNTVPEDLLLDLRLLLADGRQVRGADVYRHVMGRIWWAYPYYLLSVAPLLRQVFDWSYRTFADNRYRFSRACRLLLPSRIGTASADNNAQKP